MADTFAVYTLKPDGETYGDPVAAGLPYVTAMIVAYAISIDKFGRGGYDADSRGAWKKGKPGAQPADVLIWNEAWKRD